MPQLLQKDSEAVFAFKFLPWEGTTLISLKPILTFSSFDIRSATELLSQSRVTDRVTLKTF